MPAMLIAPMEPYTMILWGVAALAMVLVCLPMVLAILGFTRVRIEPTGGPETAAPAGDDGQYADLFERLRALGFEPLGTRVEIAWFYLWYWKRTSLPGCILATPQRDCLVSLYRLYRGDPWRVCFATILTDGTLVSTANQMERLRIDRPGYYRRGYVTDDLAELLRLHWDAVEGYRTAGYTVDAPDMVGYCQTSSERTEEYLRDNGSGQAFKCLQTALVVLAFFPLMTAMFLGVQHWVVPFSIVVSAVAFTLLMPMTIRSGARRIREQEQEQALASSWAMARRMQARGRPAGEIDPLGDGYLPAERPQDSPEAIRTEPPPWPPSDITRPPT
jgi:hypothetical protein